MADTHSTPLWHSEGFPHVWLPYTQMQTAPEPLPVVGADGVRLTLADGRTLIDGISSWWSTCHGYNHPYLVQAMQQQLQTMSHVMFAGLSNEPAYRLIKRLADITPEGLNRVFLTDSGSTAVETAIKMAVQYWRNCGEKKRKKFITFTHGYHGDTMGCMSVSDPSGMHSALGSSYAPMQYCIDLPSGEYDFAEFDALLEDIGKNTAGLIIEPLVQGAGGMRFHSADKLAEIYRICKKHDILFIADEIMTGFCRTGLMFACNEAAIQPDIMCLGKGLTGGMMTLAATIATDKIFDAFLSDELGHALMSGPTFMGNALGCAAANASLDLFQQEDRIGQVDSIEHQLLEELECCRNLPRVVDIRVKGAIGVIEIDGNQDDMWALRQQFIEKNVWLRPFGNVIYVMPPFVISPEDLSYITSTIHGVLKSLDL